MTNQTQLPLSAPAYDIDTATTAVGRLLYQRRQAVRASAVALMLRTKYETEPGHLSELVVDIAKLSWLEQAGHSRALTPELARELRAWADAAAERMRDAAGRYHLEPAPFQALVFEGTTRFPECCCLDLVLRAVLEHLIHQQREHPPVTHVLRRRA